MMRGGMGAAPSGGCGSRFPPQDARGLPHAQGVATDSGITAYRYLHGIHLCPHSSYEREFILRHARLVIDTREATRRVTHPGAATVVLA